VTEAPAGLRWVCGEVVEDEESNGGRGVACGGLIRRGFPRRTPAIDASIGAVEGLISVEQRSGRSRRRRGTDLV
jgi:hypothetical protein